MKKFLFLCLCLFFPCALKADCDYKTEKNMTSLSLYVDYSYEYNKENNLFDITVYNLQDIFAVRYKNSSYYSSNKRAVINGINPGSNITLEIYGTGVNECAGESFRTISIAIPYLNSYYGTEECKNYSKLSVCYSEFLNFDLSYTTFKNVIEREDSKNNNNEEETVNIFGEIFKILINFFINNYIKILLVIVTTSVSYIFYKNKFRKSKHGF